MPAPIRLAAILLALLVPLLAGCGSDRSGESTDGVDPVVRKAYIREMKAAAPPQNSAAQRMLNQATKAGNYPRAAVALERVIPEVRGYLRRLEDVNPPPSCAHFQRQLERVQRASIQIYTGAIPIYREDDKELVRTYILQADRVLEPVIAPIVALDGSDRVPCLYE